MQVGKNPNFQIKEILMKAATIDLVFVLDITGSMDKFIIGIKDSLRTILSNLK